MVIIKAFYESNEKEITKVYIGEKKNFFFLYVLNSQNTKVIKEIENNMSETKKLISFLKKTKESFIGFSIAEIRNNKIYFLNYGETNIGYSSGVDYDYIIEEDTIDNHFVKRFFLSSPAYICKEEEFSLENADKKINHAISHIEWSK